MQADPIEVKMEEPSDEEDKKIDSDSDDIDSSDQSDDNGRPSVTLKARKNLRKN